ncbi:hypothetical protein DV711_06200 [Motiliproteus coralliicola]|uniref:Uncharacterized protein n=1 Tax=Motiliproteus coralliicola TaxID=2283196 RepID=A0A369WX88_9GAMM|nr:hypothetical protein [Motiliproteus coralliicola]RDE25144.1 hypothetical protein DV711_06200 [Motiliproteus coralliicola]
MTRPLNTGSCTSQQTLFDTIFKMKFLDVPPASVRKVAQHTGISFKTVSRHLATRTPSKSVIDAIQTELGYYSAEYPPHFTIVALLWSWFEKTKDPDTAPSERTFYARRLRSFGVDTDVLQGWKVAKARGERDYQTRLANEAQKDMDAFTRKNTIDRAYLSVNALRKIAQESERSWENATARGDFEFNLKNAITHYRTIHTEYPEEYARLPDLAATVTELFDIGEAMTDFVTQHINSELDRGLH